MASPSFSTKQISQYEERRKRPILSSIVENSIIICCSNTSCKSSFLDKKGRCLQAMLPPALPGGQHLLLPQGCAPCCSMAPHNCWESSPRLRRCSKTSVAAPDNITGGAQRKGTEKKTPLIHISTKYFVLFADSFCSLACSKLKIKLLENNGH